MLVRVWERLLGEAVSRIGSRGHVVGWLERRSLDTSASVRGQKGEDGSLSSGCGWLEVLCVWR